MTPAWREIVRKGFRRLIQLYLDLDAGNRAFLEGKPSPESLGVLLEQRDFVLEEGRTLGNELVKGLQQKLPEQKDVEFKDLVQFLQSGDAEDQGVAAEFRQALEGLVKSDQKVDENLKNGQKELLSQIKSVRRGATMLKGYSLSDTMDSCFFDKVK